VQGWAASRCCTACAGEAEGSVVRSPACAAWRWLHSALAREAALFYSLIESVKLCGVKPRAYLREAIRRATREGMSQIQLII